MGRSYNELVQQQFKNKGTQQPAISSSSKNGGSYEQLVNRQFENRANQSSRQRTSYINKFLQDADNFYKSADKDINAENGFNAAEFFQERQKQADSLKKQAAIANQYLDQYADSYDPKDYDYLKEYLANFDTNVDDVLSLYQPSINAKQGYQAFMDDYNAYQGRVSGIQGEVMLDPSVPESALFAPIIDWMRGQRSGVTDQWTDDQKYQLGMMQMENPEEAQKYAREVNAGRDPVQEWQKTEAMKTDDLNVLQQELDALEDRYWNYQYDASTFRGRMAAEADLKQMEQEISERQRYLNQAKQVQEGEAYKALQENADFGEKSVYASPRQSIQNANISGLFTQTDPLYEYINNVGKEGYASGGHGPYADAGYDRMNEDEVAIFNYLYATEGRESARKYLDYIQETLNARVGQEMYQKYAGKPLKSLAFGVAAGVGQGLENATNLLNFGDYIPTSPTAYAAAAVRDEMGGFYLPESLGGGTIGQAAFDLANTTGNMLPAMAVGMFNPTAGAVMLGASAAGNAYQEALNSGYTKEQARTYSTLVGASEVVLEKVLGGITAIGGAMVPNKIVNKIISGFDNALPRAAISAAKLGGSMVSEGIEEGIQEALAPYIKNMTLLTDESVNWEEVAYSSLLGALSGGLMEAPGTAIDSIRYATNQRRAGDGSSSGSSSGGSVSELTRDGIQAKVSADGRGRIISTNTEADANDFHSIKGGEATIQLKDGSSVPMDDMTFANQEEAARFLTIRSLPGIETEAANDLYHAMADNNSGSDVETITGVRDAYWFGYYGHDKADASKNGTDASKLSPELRNAAFEAGQKQRAMDAAAAPRLSKAPTVKPSKDYKKVVFEGKVNIAKGTRADAEVRFMDYIAENFSGSAVHVYQSRKGVDGKRYYFDANGKRQEAPNGRYVNDELWIDLNSGDKGEGLALNTFAHEMYHHVEKWNKKGAHKLAEFVVKELGMESVESAVNAQIEKATAAGYGVEHFKKYGNNGKGMTEEQAINIVEQRAMSDFVADALETMFTRGNPQEAIARLKQEDRGLFDQIKAFIDEWVGKLKQWYSDKTISEEGRKIAEIERFEELQKLFMEAVSEAGENYRDATKEPQKGLAQDNEVQFSNRYLNQITENDQRYLDAIKRGDMETAQRMVEEAAKNAGYDSPKLYHGTNSFGFTKFDPQKSDDRISIFATSNSQVAETYSGETARRKISEKATITPEALENASPEELLKLLQENISKEYRIVSDAERSQIIEANRKPLLEAARSVENLYVINIDMFDSAKKDALFAVSGILRDMAKAEKYSDLMDKKMSYDDALWDLRWMDDSLTDEVISAIGNKENLAFRELTKWLDKTMFHADSKYSKANGTPWMNSVEAVNELYPRLFKGVYELYGRTGNAFEMMADGANWNQLDGSKIGQYGPVRTRDVSRYAYDSGYDSVIFRDIRDNADYTYSGNSDVYVFFGSNMLKSADTVTYDDDGNVIPLSERFNPEIDDVRYSTRNSNLTSNRYWYPTMKKSEIAEVKNLAKHEAKSTDNYLGIGVKWLYNNKKGHRYFALYSTADENSPTVLYACKGDQAEFEHDLLLDFVESERGLNESLNRGSTTIDRLFDSVRNAANRKNVSSDRTLGDGSNTRNVSTNSRNKRKKASPAFENCLRNLTKVQAKYKVNDDNTRNSNRNIQGDIHEVRRKLADAFDSVAKTVLEKKRAGEYREKIARAEALDSDLRIANREIMELGKAKTPTDKARHSQLRRDITRMRTELDEVNKQIRQIEILKSFRDQTQSVTDQYSKSMLQQMRDMQKENIQQQILEDRITREELTGKDSDITIMEKEFIRIVKKYEQLDAKTGKKITDLRNALKAAAKGNREMEKKFNQLWEDYEASGRKIQQLEETIARQRATAKARVESRRNTELRHKIQRKADELNRLLIRPTKHRNIPEYLQPTIAEIMKSINMEVKDIYQRTDAFEATMARYTKQIMMASTPEEAERLIQKRNEYAAKGDQFAKKMEQLQKVYQQIQDGADSNIKMDEGLYAHLMRLFVEVGDTPLGKMTSAQLEAVNDVLKITEATIVEANKLLQEGQKAGVEENSQSAMAEVRSAGGVHKLTLPVVGTVMEFSWNNLKPVYAIETIGSKVLKDLYENVRRGEDTLGRNLAEGKAFFQRQWKEYGGRDWDMEKKYRFESTSGKEFQLDLNQIMSIYALSKREQARSHLRNGGFSFESRYKTKEDVKVGPVTLKVGMESTDASAYKLSDEILGEIISKLSPQQRAFVDKMQGYLSNEMAAKGNEISLKKYGIRLFKEQNYFPLRVADQYMAKKREQQTGDRKLKNSGFTKEVTPEAKNPVVLGGFLEVWGEHVDEMSMYNAFVLPLDDFERVLNYHGQFTENGEATSVVEAIRNAYGEGATRYLDNLIRDINGGARTDSVAKSINRMTSKAKKAQTMASLSVAIQQPSAVIRAMAMVDGKYFIGPKVTEMNHGRTWEEMKKYAPITIIKEMGGFDTNVGQSTVEYLTDRTEYNGFLEKAQGLIKDEKYRDEVLGWLPGYMDELAWGAIWNAVKREQRAAHPDMNHSGDAFLKIVADRFTDVVTHTQVYDSVFSRSGMMRSKDTAVKMVTSFMAEPTTTANMLYSALVNAKRGGGKAQLGRTVAALAGALALNSALVSLVYAMRDDEEDKRYDEKWIENFRENVLEGLNPATYIPIIRDIDSMRKGFDIDRTDMSLYGDLMNAINGLTDEDRSAWEKVETVIGATGNLIGIPVKNIIRDGKGLFTTIANAMDHDDPATRTGRAMAWRGEDLDDGDQLLMAIQRGDEEHIQRVAGRYEDQDAAERALTTAIGNQYREGKLTAEEVTELLGTNTGMDADDIYWKLDEWNYARDNGSSDGYLKYGKLVEAIESGNSAEEIQRYLSNGADAGTVRSQITRAYKESYMGGDEDTRSQIRDKVRPAYEALGTEDVDALFNSWDFEAQYGMTYTDYKAAFLDGDVSESQMREAMDSYGRMQFQIEEDIRDLKKEKAFRDRFHMSLTEMYEAYDHGDIAKNTLISAMEFSGKTREEAREAVTRRDIENRMGIDYMKLDDAYKWGDITRQELYNAMLENGATKQEADEAIVGYDWLKKNVKRYPDLTISDAKKFTVTLGEKSPEETLADYGVSVDAYLKYQQLRPECKGVDANGDGKTDSGTLRDSVFRMIDSLPISDEAKDGLALQSYSMSSIKKNAPWH